MRRPPGPLFDLPPLALGARRAATRGGLLLLLQACAAPDPCAPMCEAAAAAYGACLDPDGAGGAPPDWAAAGYDDRRAFRDACDTWAWEQRLIAAEEGDPDRVDAACAQREEALRAAADPCAAFSDMEWSAPLR